MRKGRIVADHGTHYMRERIHWQTGEVLPGRRQRIERYLCLGGPLAGVWRSGEELVDEGHAQNYWSFNRAGRTPPGVGHSMVFIHTEMLK